EPEAAAVESLASEPQPALSADTDQPPTVLVLTPPPEVPTEPARTEAEPTPTESAEPEQAPLFEATTQAEPVLQIRMEDEEPATEGRAFRWSETASYAAAGLVGLVAFGAGIVGFQMAA